MSMTRATATHSQSPIPVSKKEIFDLRLPPYLPLGSASPCFCQSLPFFFFLFLISGLKESSMCERSGTWGTLRC